MEASRDTIQVTDLGAGSKGPEPVARRIGDIARASLTPWKYALFYRDLAMYFESRRIIELGTCLGITSLYLAQKKDATIYSFEGSAALAALARKNFAWAGRDNIQIIEGNIDQTLHRFLDPTDKIDFVLMDANHRYEPTVRYYHQLTRRVHNKTVMVIDDIHQSEEMEKAWKEIQKDTLVYGSIDMYRCGILFFDPRIGKHHYVWSLK